MIVIIDYGVGNLTSIKNMIKKAGAEAVISADLEQISRASKFILPGIGAFDHGIQYLKKAPYFEMLNHRVLNEKVPVLGVCLGVQLFTGSSEEGVLPGLGWINGKVVKFRPEKMNNSNLKVPHMGWADVDIRKESRLFKDMHDEPRFYFVHSYHLVCDDSSDILVNANYGYNFVAGVEKDNIVGTQFHPEKSHKFGLKIYENFLKYY